MYPMRFYKRQMEGLFMPTFKEFQQQIGEWGNTTFPTSTVDSVLAHMKEEAVELRALPRTEEAADMGLLLTHVAYKSGFDLFEELDKLPEKGPRTTRRAEHEYVDGVMRAHDILQRERTPAAAAELFAALIEFCYHQGTSLRSAMEAKFEINQRRTWQPTQNANGYQKHVEA
jgi:hypothetical protein